MTKTKITSKDCLKARVPDLNFEDNSRKWVTEIEGNSLGEKLLFRCASFVKEVPSHQRWDEWQE